MFLDRRLTQRPADVPSTSPLFEGANDERYASEHCWFLEFVFRNAELSENSPVAEIVDALVGSGLPEGARQDVHTIINELYVNALDHGVLGLSDCSKRDAEDFSEYYRQRDLKLSTLAAAENSMRAWIKVECELQISDRPSLQIIVADSGRGLPTAPLSLNNIIEAAGEPVANDSLRDRGMQIVQALVTDIHFFGQRNQVKVVYRC